MIWILWCWKIFLTSLHLYTHWPCNYYLIMAQCYKNICLSRKEHWREGSGSSQDTTYSTSGTSLDTESFWKNTQVMIPLAWMIFVMQFDGYPISCLSMISSTNISTSIWQTNKTSMASTYSTNLHIRTIKIGNGKQILTISKHKQNSTMASGLLIYLNYFPLLKLNNKPREIL